MSALSNSDETKKKCEKNFRRFCTKFEQNPHVNLNQIMGNFGKNEQNPHDNLSLKYRQKLLK